MARPALTEEQRRQTRRNIREAAAKLYAQKGIGDISARTIAETAGVSVGTLYSYFSNLTELMQSLWKEPLVRLLNELESAVAATEEPMAKVRVVLATYAKFATQQQGIYRGAFMFVRPAAHDQPTPVALEQDRFFSILCGAIAAAQQQGLTRSGAPESLTQTVWSGIHGAIALPTNIDRLALAPANEALPVMIDAMLEWLQHQEP